MSQKEADRWFARRREPRMREKSAAAFQRWRGDPEHAREFADTERIWDQLENLPLSPALQNLMDGPASPGLRDRVVSLSSRKPLLLAAGLAAVAVLAYWQWTASGVQTFTTAVGEQRTHTLADGTRVVLNTRTTVDIAYSRGKRAVRLQTGEAIFDVAKAPGRPFIVTAGSGSVTALGTRFLVRHEGEASSVTLMEGSVQVARTGERAQSFLLPGQQAAYSDSLRGIVTRSVDIAVSGSWTRGRLEFRSTPLWEAVAEANRYSSSQMRIEHPALNDLPVSGTFRTGDITGLAAALESYLPVKALHDRTGIRLVPR